MTEYLIKIMGLISFTVVLINLLPTGKTTALIKNVVRLCVYLSIIAPIVTFFINFKDGENQELSKIFPNYFSETVIETDADYIKYCSEKNVKNAEDLLVNKIKTEYGVSTYVDIKIKNSDRAIDSEIEKIFVTFLDEYSKEARDILKKNLESEYAVTVEFIN